MPKLSVLIPTFNYARYLPEAIESVLSQSFADFELLIVDDASTDETRQIIEQYALNDSRIRFHIHAKNIGMVQNWNAALGMACGEYAKFLFGDDKLCNPRALEEMVAAMESDASISLVMSGRRILDENSRELHSINFAASAGLEDGHALILRSLEQTRNILGEPSASMFRKRFAARGFDPAYRQLVDLEFWFHLLEQGNFFYLAEPLCGFRIHESQQTAVNRAEQVDSEEYLRLLQKYSAKPYLGEAVGKRFLFNNIYALARSRGTTAPSEMELELRSKLSGADYVFQWLRYKITRPANNLRQSIRKRLG
ncbi:MAG: glycosyltransferase [Verrucomicrobia bacterium]|nr:glycosyltransferase [Verrucomicrobiota bacterium]